ncbi:hypothetical protein HDU97_007339 [Phlyctochytrium planicorne]|nr:hypothetical protein HDU97_007339 [Phlyctochytrium planicorne]
MTVTRSQTIKAAVSTATANHNQAVESSKGVASGAKKVRGLKARVGPKVGSAAPSSSKKCSINLTADIESGKEKGIPGSAQLGKLFLGGMICLAIESARKTRTVAAIGHGLLFSHHDPIHRHHAHPIRQHSRNRAQHVPAYGNPTLLHYPNAQPSSKSSSPLSWAQKFLRPNQIACEPGKNGQTVCFHK